VKPFAQKSASDNMKCCHRGLRGVPMKQIRLTTDGACIGNPGPGGWAFVLRYKDRLREGSGAERNTTNNRMELRAVIEGLRTLNKPCAVLVRTDSKYLRDGMTTWIQKWKPEDWIRIKNRTLWQEVDRLQRIHKVSCKWVKGHVNDEDNERCHLLANKAARSVN